MSIEQLHISKETASAITELLRRNNKSNLEVSVQTQCNKFDDHLSYKDPCEDLQRVRLLKTHTTIGR